jgi:hypothetical protein
LHAGRAPRETLLSPTYRATSSLGDAGVCASLGHLDQLPSNSIRAIELCPGSAVGPEILYAQVKRATKQRITLQSLRSSRRRGYSHRIAESHHHRSRALKAFDPGVSLGRGISTTLYQDGGLAEPLRRADYHHVARMQRVRLIKPLTPNGASG